MSAPSSAYLTEKLPLQDVGVAKYDNLLALKLSEYGSNIKSLFYLDALLVAKENGGTKEGFCGMVIVGGANAAMHNTARYGKGRTSPDGGATKYIILNDGGLNTLGYSEWKSNDSLVFTDILVDVEFKTAYYLSSNAYGVRYRYRNVEDTAWGAWDTVDMQPIDGAIAAKTTATITVPVPSPGTPYRKVQVVGFMTNDEGTFEEPFGAILELTLVSVLLENNTSWTDNPTTYYIDTPTIEPKTEGGQTQLYTNPNQTGLITIPIARLWEDNRFYYTYGYDIESDKYIILSRVDSTATPTSWTYQGYSAISQLDADNQVISGTGTPGTIYYNDGDNTWHISWSSGVFGALADDGYYAQGDISGVTDTKHLIGGVQQ